MRWRIISDGVLELATQGRFKIRQIDLGVKVSGEVGLILSGINYIIDVFRGRIPAWDPQAVYSRLMTEPAINKSDYVICDTPPELFTPTMWGLYVVDYIIIPSNMEEPSLLGVKTFKVLLSKGLHKPRHFRCLNRLTNCECPNIHPSNKSSLYRNQGISILERINFFLNKYALLNWRKEFWFGN